MSDTRWMSDLLDQQQQWRHEKTISEAAQPERRRVWLARAPEFFARLKHQMRALIGAFEAELQLRQLHAYIAINDGASAKATYRYNDDDLWFQLELDSKKEVVLCSDRSGRADTIALKLDAEMNIVAVAESGDYLLVNGNEATALAKPFFKEITKAAMR